MIKYYLMKIIQSFVFPPGLIILFLFFASLFTKRLRKFFLFLTLISYLLSTQFIGNLLIAPLENHFYHEDNSTKADLVVILGGGYYEGTPNLQLSQGSIKRALYGLMLAKENGIPLLYNGASLESKNAKLTYGQMNKSLRLDLKFAKTMRYKRDFIAYFEDRALNTKDNARLTKEFLDKNNLKNPTIYLVSSAYHLVRAIEVFRNTGLKVVPKATDFQTNKEVCYCNFFPSNSGLRKSQNALHEYVAILRNRLMR